MKYIYLVTISLILSCSFTSHIIAQGYFNITHDSNSVSSAGIINYPLVLSALRNTNNTETGIAFRISTIQGSANTPGAAITHIRNGAGSRGHLAFKTRQVVKKPLFSEKTDFLAWR